MILGFASRTPGISVPGFLLDIVRGVRAFKESLDSADAKADTSDNNNNNGETR